MRALLALVAVLLVATPALGLPLPTSPHVAVAHSIEIARTMLLPFSDCFYEGTLSQDQRADGTYVIEILALVPQPQSVGFACAPERSRHVAFWDLWSAALADPGVEVVDVLIGDCFDQVVGLTIASGELRYRAERADICAGMTEVVLVSARTTV